jgi:hypothetical protein
MWPAEVRRQHVPERPLAVEGPRGLLRVGGTHDGRGGRRGGSRRAQEDSDMRRAFLESLGMPRDLQQVRRGLGPGTLVLVLMRVLVVGGAEGACFWAGGGLDADGGDPAVHGGAGSVAR